MTSKNITPHRGLESGPLRSQIDRYLNLLRDRGYKRYTTYYDELLLVDLGCWLARRVIGVCDLNEAVAAEFLRSHMRSRRTRRVAKRATLRRFLAMLRQQGEIPDQPQSQLSPIEELVDDFGQYLTTERGFVKTTVAGYRRAVRAFLRKCFGSGVIELEKIDAPQIIAFARWQAHRHVPITTQSTLSGLRSFLRFLWDRRRLDTDLSSSVPKIAMWALAGLPKCLPAGAVEKVIACSSDVGPIGSRNHAILLVFVRLGLRS